MPSKLNIFGDLPVQAIKSNVVSDIPNYLRKYKEDASADIAEWSKNSTASNVDSVILAMGSGSNYTLGSSVLFDTYSKIILGKTGYENRWQLNYHVTDENFIISYFDGNLQFKRFSIDYSSGTLKGKNLDLRNGNQLYCNSNYQLSFGYSSEASYEDISQYRHNIRSTFSNAKGYNSENALDFYMWDVNNDTPDEIGSRHVYRLNALGNEELISGFRIDGGVNYTLTVDPTTRLATTTDEMANYSVLGKGIIYYNSYTNTYRYSENGGVFKEFASKSDIATALNNQTGPTYQILWYGNDVASSGTGPIVSTPQFTFGDTVNHSGALCAPSIQAVGSYHLGTGKADVGFWDSSVFWMANTTSGSIVQLSPGLSTSTKYIYAHNNSNNASVVTDKASFQNLSNNGIVYAYEDSTTSEDLIYLHTSSGFTFSPTSNLLNVTNITMPSTGIFTGGNVWTFNNLTNIYNENKKFSSQKLDNYTTMVLTYDSNISVITDINGSISDSTTIEARPYGTVSNDWSVRHLSNNNNPCVVVSNGLAVGGILNLEGSALNIAKGTQLSTDGASQYMPRIKLFNSSAIWTGVIDNSTCSTSQNSNVIHYFGSSWNETVYNDAYFVSNNCLVITTDKTYTSTNLAGGDIAIKTNKNLNILANTINIGTLSSQTYLNGSIAASYIIYSDNIARTIDTSKYLHIYVITQSLTQTIGNGTYTSQTIIVKNAQNSGTLTLVGNINAGSSTIPSLTTTILVWNGSEWY